MALPIFTTIYLCLAVFRLNYPYLGVFALNCPDFTICAIFTLYMHSSIETAPLCKTLEQLDHYSWRYCISKIWGIQDSSPLYKIWKQSDHYLWRYCIWRFGGYECRLAANTVVLVLGGQISIATYLRGVSTLI